MVWSTTVLSIFILVYLWVMEIEWSKGVWTQEIVHVVSRCIAAQKTLLIYISAVRVSVSRSLCSCTNPQECWGRWEQVLFLALSLSSPLVECVVRVCFACTHVVCVFLSSHWNKYTQNQTRLQFMLTEISRTVVPNLFWSWLFWVFLDPPFPKKIF